MSGDGPLTILKDLDKHPVTSLIGLLVGTDAAQPWLIQKWANGRRKWAWKLVGTSLFLQEISRFSLASLVHANL